MSQLFQGVSSCPVILSWSRSDEAEQVWLWEYETDEGAHDLYMDQGEDIRFRVTDEVFVDTSPTGPAAAKSDTPAAQAGQSSSSTAAPPPPEEGKKKEAPYTLIVSKKNVWMNYWFLFWVKTKQKWQENVQNC